MCSKWFLPPRELLFDRVVCTAHCDQLSPILYISVLYPGCGHVNKLIHAPYVGFEKAVNTYYIEMSVRYTSAMGEPYQGNTNQPGLFVLDVT